MDLWVAILLAEEGSLDAEVAVALHLGYSVALLAVAGPIMKIHFGLISRNELAQEWRSNQHYANNTSKGDNVYVEELSDDEFNEIFDRGEFIYDKNRNPFDHGFARNCLNFWCKPRWPADSNVEEPPAKGAKQAPVAPPAASAAAEEKAQSEMGALVVETMNFLGMAQNSERFLRLLQHSNVTSLRHLECLSQDECLKLQLPWDLVAAVQKRLRDTW
eukprot:g29391.t1